jgi:Arc/MetJ family transcription regulator
MAYRINAEWEITVTKNKMKRRCIIIDDATWAAVVRAAKVDGRSAGSWIRRALAACIATRAALIGVACEVSDAQG